MECKYCKRKFKNEHGLHIHYFYCFKKDFIAMEIIKTDQETLFEFESNEIFIPVSRYLFELYPLIAKGEVGMFKNKRYVL